MTEAAKITPDHPVYLDRFLEGAVECGLDALCDGDEVYVGGVLEHIEEAGIHSGDSACCTPPFALSEAIVSQLRATARRLALRIGVVGAHQHPVRHQGSDDLHHRGQPAREPHRAVRVEGHGRAAGEVRRPHHGGGEDRRSGASARRAPSGAFQREGARDALRALPRHRHRAGARDEVHRRGDGIARNFRRPTPRRSWPSTTTCRARARCS